MDVGQGDATLISYLGKYQVLIDGGPSGKRLLQELGKQMPTMDKKIEIVILTHPDFDHLAGLIDVARSYEIGIFLDNGQKADTEIFKELENVLAKEEIKKNLLFEGSRISIGRYLNFEIFNPDEISGNKKNRNENSIVLKMVFGNNTFLFTGDATSKVEGDMINKLIDLDVDWLKIGHHGSKHSSSQEFLEKTSPRFAIISVGAKNGYKHPATEVIERIKKQKITLFRTDKLGTIEVFCRVPTKECATKNN